MNPLIKRVHDARTKCEMDIRSIIETAEAEKRELTAEDDENISRLDAESRAANDRLGELLEAEQRNADIEAALAKYGDQTLRSDTDTDTDTAETTDADIDAELRKLGRGEVRSVMVPPTRRDLTKGTATAGGNTVPTSFYDRLIEHMIEVSGVLQAGPTILRTASGESIEVPVTTAFSSASLIAEAATLTESDPAFAKRTLGAYKYAFSTQVSSELVADTGVDLLGFLARQSGRAVGNALGVDLVTGNGSSKPSGIVQTATTGVTGGTGVTGAFTADNLIDLHYSVIGPYRSSPSCAWLMRDATLANVRKLKDTTNNYLWQPSLVAGAPDLLLGKPVYTDPNVAAVGLGAKSVIFGDIASYFVRLAGGIRFERSDEFAFQNDLVTFRCIVRGDGILADQTGAVKVFVGGAS